VGIWFYCNFTDVETRTLGRVKYWI